MHSATTAIVRGDVGNAMVSSAIPGMLQLHDEMPAMS